MQIKFGAKNALEKMNESKYVDFWGIISHSAFNENFIIFESE
jgi:hypothetical protein